MAVGYSGPELEPHAITYSIYTNGAWAQRTTLPDTANIEEPQVSCARPDFCVVGGDLGTSTGRADKAVVYTYDGHNWSDPTALTARSAGADQPFLRSLSCVNSSFCVAISDERAFIFNGTDWDSGTPLGHDPWHLHCYSTAFCLAYGNDFGLNGIVMNYDGVGWHLLHTFKSSNTINYDVSSMYCFSSTSCLATLIVNDHRMKTLVYNGSQWHVDDNMGGYVSIDSEQCWSLHNCLGDYHGYFWRFNGTSWHKAGTYESGKTGLAEQFACFSKTKCVAAGYILNNRPTLYRFH